MKNCYNCKYKDMPCHDRVGYCIGYSGWQPKEEKIQMSEEQAMGILVIAEKWNGFGVNFKLKKLKEKGYIKQTELEIAKESFYKDNDEENFYTFAKMSTMYIKELEKEIERLTK